jgi:peptide deformylase
MRLKIIQVGEPVLRAQARQLTGEEIISDQIQRLIRDMQETMRDAPGVGLAAPQVGMALQLAVIEDRQELLSSLPPQELAERERNPVPFQVIINPELLFSATILPISMKVVSACLDFRPWLPDLGRFASHTWMNM